MRREESSENKRPPTPEELDVLAVRVLGSASEAADWLDAPHPLLDSRTPRSAAARADGRHRVEQILLRLEHSLPT